MALSSYERETIINFDEEEDTAGIYTHNKEMLRTLKRLAKSRPKECRLYRTSHKGQAAEFYIPKGWVQINPSRKSATANTARSSLK